MCPSVCVFWCTYRQWLLSIHELDLYGNVPMRCQSSIAKVEPLRIHKQQVSANENRDRVNISRFVSI